MPRRPDIYVLESTGTPVNKLVPIDHYGGSFSVGIEITSGTPTIAVEYTLDPNPRTTTPTNWATVESGLTADTVLHWGDYPALQFAATAIRLRITSGTGVVWFRVGQRASMLPVRKGKFTQGGATTREWHPLEVGTRLIGLDGGTPGNFPADGVVLEGNQGKSRHPEFAGVSSTMDNTTVKFSANSLKCPDNSFGGNMTYVTGHSSAFWGPMSTEQGNATAFSVSIWARANSFAVADRWIASNEYNDPGEGWLIQIDSVDQAGGERQIKFTAKTTTDTTIVSLSSGSTTIATGEWVWITVAREPGGVGSSARWAMWINGNRVDIQAETGNMSVRNSNRVAQHYSYESVQRSFDGWTNDFVITCGGESIGYVQSDFVRYDVDSTTIDVPTSDTTIPGVDDPSYDPLSRWVYAAYRYDSGSEEQFHTLNTGITPSFLGLTAIENGQSKWGTHSVAINGGSTSRGAAGVDLTPPANPGKTDWLAWPISLAQGNGLGSSLQADHVAGELSVEVNFYMTGSYTTYCLVYIGASDTYTVGQYAVIVYNNTLYLLQRTSASAFTTRLTSAFSGLVTANTWHNLRVESYGHRSTTYMVFNGTRSGSFVRAQNVSQEFGNAQQPFRFGGFIDLEYSYVAPVRDFEGYMDGFRITAASRHGGDRRQVAVGTAITDPPLPCYQPTLSDPLPHGAA